MGISEAIVGYFEFFYHGYFTYQKIFPAPFLDVRLIQKKRILKWQRAHPAVASFGAA
jgi:hypothetical protein